VKIPTSLKINGKTWKVVREDTPDFDDGETDFSTRTIRLAPRLSGEDLSVCFLHELLHACAGLEVDLFAEGWDELFVTLLAPRLLPVLKQVGLK
jgi:hypothetical protein